MTYLRDRLTVARDLLAESGSVFVQISNENVHRVTALMDEVFGDRNRCTTILMKKSGWASSGQLPQVHDFIVWYAKDIEQIKYRQLYRAKIDEEFGNISGAWVESPDGTETSRLLKKHFRTRMRCRDLDFVDVFGDWARLEGQKRQFQFRRSGMGQVFQQPASVLVHA